MKKVKWLYLFLTVFFASTFYQSVFAQEKSEPKKDLKNTVRFNISNPIVFGGRSIVFGYERIVNSRQSFSVNFGSTGFPRLKLINSDSLQAKKNVSSKGYNFSVDYRFYLGKENKYAAPRGVYIGPYYSFNYFDKKNTWTVKTTAGANTDVESDLGLNIHTVGFELGYQFVFWDRLALDLILLGPGVSFYNLKADLGTNLSQADKERLFNALNDALADKFPAYNFVIDDGEFKKNGATKTTSFGYRYMIQIGFRF